MKRFAALYRALEGTTSSTGKLAALTDYLAAAPSADAAWAVYLLAGGTPRRVVPSPLVHSLAQKMSGYPDWLFQECYQAVGDLAETIALLLPPPPEPLDRTLAETMQSLLALRKVDPVTLPAAVEAQWNTIAADQRLVYYKLMMGAFRVGVSRLQVTNALSVLSGVDAKIIAQRLMGATGIHVEPTALDYERIISLPPAETAALGKDSASTIDDIAPYPFFLAHAIPRDEDVATLLGDPSDWLAEWKWDGIRAQCVRRGESLAIWSRGEELVTDRFPEIVELLQSLPSGTVIDGELVVADVSTSGWRVRPFADLQRRIGRKVVSAKLRKEIPAFLIAFDLLEVEGVDIRDRSQRERREELEKIHQRFPSPAWDVSPIVSTATTWDALAEQRASARTLRSEGLMLKHMTARYGVGRTKNDGVWWKWKLDPLTVDAVLVYAQKGNGRRANLFSDYTFAVWDRSAQTPELVPFAKAYSGLTDAEMRKVDAIIRKTTKEAFGPVRSVDPTMVFEIGFEGIAKSTRHKSGIATRFPRILRWRQDKKVEEADTLEIIRQMAEPSR